MGVSDSVISVVLVFIARLHCARNTDRCTSKGGFCLTNHSSFWRGKVYLDIRRGSPPATALK